MTLFASTPQLLLLYLRWKMDPAPAGGAEAHAGSSAELPRLSNDSQESCVYFRDVLVPAVVSMSDSSPTLTSRRHELNGRHHRQQWR